jgi:hypothetical protein
MKYVFLCMCLLVMLASCSKPRMHGRVLDDLRVDFGEGVTGTCAFDNEPHPGDDVTVNDDGRCHATPQK